MFDIGFFELVLTAVVALLVLGPERLPVAARTAGKWFGQARRMVSQFTTEIDRQLKVEELRAKLTKEGESLDIEGDIKKIQATLRSSLNEVDQLNKLSPDVNELLYGTKHGVNDLSNSVNSDSESTKTQ